MNIKKLLSYLVWVEVLSWFLIIVLFGWWMLYPYRILEVKEVKILTPTVKAGGNVSYSTTACKYMDIPLEVSKFLVNDVFLPYPPYEAQTFIGCKTAVVTQPVPEFAEGTHHIRVVVLGHPNPIRNFSYTYDTPNFEIIK